MALSPNLIGAMNSPKTMFLAHLINDLNEANFEHAVRTCQRKQWFLHVLKFCLSLLSSGFAWRHWRCYSHSWQIRWRHRQNGPRQVRFQCTKITVKLVVYSCWAVLESGKRSNQSPSQSIFQTKRSLEVFIIPVNCYFTCMFTFWFLIVQAFAWSHSSSHETTPYKSLLCMYAREWVWMMHLLIASWPRAGLNCIRISVSITLQEWCILPRSLMLTHQ